MNRTVKLKGTNLFSKERWDIIRTVVSIVNTITMKASMLAKAYYLQKEVELTKDFYDLCFKVVTDIPYIHRKDLTPEKQARLEMYGELKSLFQDNFGSHVDIQNFSISHILSYSSKLLETCMLNNIQFHFPKYISLFLSQHFDDKAKRYEIKNHLLFDKTCDENLLNWVQEHKAFLLPKREQSYDKDIQERPWLYLRHMVQICRQIDPGKKTLSPLVLHRSFIPKHIHIDTVGLVQLLMGKKDIEDFVKQYELKYGTKPNIKTKADLGSSYKKVFGTEAPAPEVDFNYQKFYWEYMCRLDHPKYKRATNQENLTFGNSITTDGCSVSLLLVDKPEKKKYKGRQVTKKKSKDEFDFKPQPDTLFLGCDPGKDDLVAITDGSDKFKYTKGQLHKDCKRSLFERRGVSQRAELVIEGLFQSKKAIVPGYYAMLENPTLLQYESEVLSQSSSRSCDQGEFLKYVRAKMYMEDTVSKLYERPRFRNDKFSKYCLTKSSYDKMLHRLQKFVANRQPKRRTYDGIVQQNVNKQFYQHVNIFYGDWGRNPNLKNQAPTPGKGLRRKIHKVYPTITTCEHFTSKTCPCCKQRTLVKPLLDGDNRVVREKHHLLRCTNCSSWWNRNWAGAYNILSKGLEQWIGLNG